MRISFMQTSSTQEKTCLEKFYKICCSILIALNEILDSETKFQFQD